MTDQQNNEPITELDPGRRPGTGTIWYVGLAMTAGTIICLFVLLPLIHQYWDMARGLDPLEMESEQANTQARVRFQLAVGIVSSWFALSGIIWTYLATRHARLARILTAVGAVAALGGGLFFWIVAVTGRLGAAYDPMIFITALVLTGLCWHLAPSAIWHAVYGRALAPARALALMRSDTKRLMAVAAFMLAVPPATACLVHLHTWPRGLVNERLFTTLVMAVLLIGCLQLAWYAVFGQWLRPGRKKLRPDDHMP